MLDRQRRDIIDQLAGLIAAREGGGDAISGERSSSMFPPGWSGPQDGLPAGVVHEWLDGSSVGQHGCWTPPLFVSLHVCSQRLAGRCGAAMWIGCSGWPDIHALARLRLLQHSVFVDPPDTASTIWAVDSALRSPAVAFIAADGSRLDMASTRRLQLAAARSNAVILLLRPGWEAKSCLSAAATRWLISPVQSHHARPRWSVELIRCKGLQQQQQSLHQHRDAQQHRHQKQQWILEWNHAENHLSLPADVADRPHSASTACWAAQRRSAS
ncbi:MAG: ImuA family protein [Phycisphaerales bacterium]